MLCPLFIHYPSYTHTIPNVSPGLIYRGVIIRRIFGLVYRGAYIGYFTLLYQQNVFYVAYLRQHFLKIIFVISAFNVQNV